MVVRVVEEKAEPAISSALAPPDLSLFDTVTDQIAVLDNYLAMLPPMSHILKEFVDGVLGELPAKGAAQASLEGILNVLQVRTDASACLRYAHAWFNLRTSVIESGVVMTLGLQRIDPQSLLPSLHKPSTSWSHIWDLYCRVCTQAQSSSGSRCSGAHTTMLHTSATKSPDSLIALIQCRSTVAMAVRRTPSATPLARLPPLALVRGVRMAGTLAGVRCARQRCGVRAWRLSRLASHKWTPVAMSRCDHMW